mgnify:CR=1 FL=1
MVLMIGLTGGVASNIDAADSAAAVWRCGVVNGRHNGVVDTESIIRLVGAGLIVIAAIGCLTGVKRAVGGLAQKVPRLNAGKVTNGFRLIILIIALILLLNLFNFPLTAIVATLGAVSCVVMIGFVAQWSVLSNFSCTFLLILFKPFAVGDELAIPSEKIKGRVIDITLMFTVIEDEEGILINVPNNRMFQSHFRRRPALNGIKLSEQIRKSEPARLQEPKMDEPVEIVSAPSEESDDYKIT